MATDPQAMLREQFPDLTDAQRTAMLDNLTPEEREGLLDPDLVDGVGVVGDPQDGAADDGGEPEAPAKTEKPEKPEKPEKAAVETKEEEEPGRNEEEEEEEEEERADEAAGAGAEAAAVETAEEVDDDDSDIVSPPRMQWQAPENAKARLEAFDTELAKLAEQFDDGEISSKEFTAKTNAVNNQKFQLQGQINEANVAFKINEQGWNTVCQSFLNKYPAYRDNPRLFAMLDGEVRKLQEAADDAFDPKILTQARKLIEQDLPALAPKPSAKNGGKTETPKKAIVRPRADPPPNLGALPAAAATETGNNRFAQLDRLSTKDPEAFEAAMARLSEAEREAYLAS